MKRPTTKRTARQVAELLLGPLDQAAEPYFISQNSGALRAGIERAMQEGHVTFKSIAHRLRGTVDGKDDGDKNATHALDAPGELGRGSP